MEAGEPFQRRISSEQIGQSPERTGMIFAERDISIELTRTGKGIALGPRDLFCRIRVAVGCDKGAKKPNVFLVDHTVLIHVDLTRNIIGEGKWIFEKGIQYLQVISCPAVIAVQIAEHDQFGVRLHTMGGNREFPVSQSQDNENTNGQDQLLPLRHLQAPKECVDEFFFVRVRGSNQSTCSGRKDKPLFRLYPRETTT
jgi:hypothetical protein